MLLPTLVWTRWRRRAVSAPSPGPMCMHQLAQRLCTWVAPWYRVFAGCAAAPSFHPFRDAALHSAQHRRPPVQPPCPAAHVEGSHTVHCARLSHAVQPAVLPTAPPTGTGALQPAVAGQPTPLVGTLRPACGPPRSCMGGHGAPRTAQRAPALHGRACRHRHLPQLCLWWLQRCCWQIVVAVTVTWTRLEHVQGSLAPAPMRPSRVD